MFYTEIFNLTDMTHMHVQYTISYTIYIMIICITLSNFYNNYCIESAAIVASFWLEISF